MSSAAIARLLRPFVRLEAREVRRALMLTSQLFIVLLAYYLLKSEREVLILAAPGARAELKTYAAAAQSLLLVGLSLGFGALAGRVRRRALLTTVTLFFTSHLLIFWGVLALWPAQRLAIGLVFYVWLGCFNLLIVAQFWAFANDLYDRADGERIFPLLAFGGAVGAVAGARLAKPLFALFGDTVSLCVGAVLLVASLVLALAVDEHAAPRTSVAPVVDGNGVSLLRASRYLQLLALLAVIKNWVNAFGEYLLDRRLLERAHQLPRSEAAAYIGAFKSDYLTYGNLFALVVQLAVVSRLMRRLGAGGALLLLPTLVLIGYSGALVVPALPVLLAVKVGENGTDYSLQKTAEQALFLVTSRSAKYKVKAIVDGFCVRFGDVLAAGLVAILVALAVSTRGGVAVALVLASGTLLVSLFLAMAHRRRASSPCADPPAHHAHPTLRAPEGVRV